MAETQLFFHTHWDREWYLPFRQTQQRLLPVMDRLLALLESGGLERFTLDGQTVLLDDYREFRPTEATRFEALIRAKRVSIGPWFVMPDEFLVSGESLLRNLELGIQTSRALGQETFTGYLPDTFGHAADTPMILATMGIESAVLWRGVAPKESVFLWTSPSGASITTLHLSEGYFQNHAHMEDSYAEASNGMRAFHQKITQALPQDVPALFPVGADHLGLTETVIRRALDCFPNAQTVTIDAAMRSLSETIPVSTLDTISGELLDCRRQYVLPGVWSARMYLKQANRRAEWTLTQQLEPLQVLLAGLGVASPQTAETAFLWRTLLLNHPHDSICGCSVDVVHRENEQRFEDLAQVAGTCLEALHWNAFQCLVPSTEQAKHTGLLAVNLSTTPYTGVLPVLVDAGPSTTDAETPPSTATQQVIQSQEVLEDSYLRAFTTIPLAHNRSQKQHRLIWVDSLPSLSLSALSLSSLAPCPSAEHVTVSETHLENRFLRVDLAANGSLSVTDKQTGKTHHGLHQPVRSRQQGDSYNAAPVPGSMPEHAELESCVISHSGPLRGAITLNYRFPLSLFRLQTTVELDAGTPRLGFETQFVNILKNHQLQIAFESNAPVTCVQAEGHYNIIERPYDPEYRIEAQMPAPAMTELKTNTGPIQRFIQWQHQALITEGLTEYEVSGRTLKLTLLRAFSALSADTTGVRGSQAGPPLETPEGQCLNRAFVCRYAWQPTMPETAAELFTASERFMGVQYGIHYRQTEAITQFQADSTPITPQESPYTGLSLDNPNIRMTALRRYPSIPNTLALHLHNTQETEQAVRLSGKLLSGKTLQRLDLATQQLTPLPDGPIKIPQRDLVILAIVG